MYKRALVIVTVTIVLGAAWVRAQEAAALKTKVLNGTITGTLSRPVAGACAVTGFAAICPSGAAKCSCVTMNAAKVTGNLAGTGSAVVNITIDSGISTSAVSVATCQAGFGVANITTIVGKGKNKTTKTETLNLLASLCDKLSPNSADTITGSFGIAASPAPSPAASGWGTMDGTERGSTATLKLKGSITQ
jgi:hypothetical protein